MLSSKKDILPKRWASHRGGGNPPHTKFLPVFTGTVILGLIQDLPRLPLLFINNLRGRFQIKFGMTPLYNNGFTLIELLVVVLIIGILAAVAVPQYKVAVVKSRVGSMLNLAASITKAQEIYYTAHGEYAEKLNKLDIDIPATCTPLEYEGNNPTDVFQCSNYFILLYDHNSAVNATYCPDNTSSVESCFETRDFLINFRLLHRTSAKTTGGKRYCDIQNDSALGKKVCSQLTGFECGNC